MWDEYHAPGTVAETLELLARHGDACRIIAGGTDLILEIERSVRPQRILVDISRITGLDGVAISGGRLQLGALTTHAQMVASTDAVAHAFPLARACWLVGAPQIRNRGTVAGNLVTASPANDTITPLWAMDAQVTLASRDGERTLPFDRFFLGVRRTAMRPDEMLVRIAAPILESNERGTFLKLGLRQAQAISVVNAAVVVALAADGITVERARIALGAVAPTIVRAGEAEAYLAGRVLDDEAIAQAAVLAAAAARPISDVRGSADYRRDMARVLVARALNQLRNGTECADWPAQPVLLWGGKDHPGLNSEAGADEGAKSAKDAQRDEHEDHGAVRLNVNGREMALRGVRGKTLLRALREDAGLTGTKEGCAEGECGACTVWLDGVAVMSCLVPVERAAGCEVTTVEGLADGERLHPLQQAFVEAGAVQCGYCTPGLLMSAANLLGEVAAPTTAQVREALTGNLCRCTGYYRIVEAVERAAQARQPA